MRVGKPVITMQGPRMFVAYDVRSDSFPPRLWFSVDTGDAGLLSELSDAALAALLMPAMAQGEPLQLEGEVSDRLLFNVGRLQAVIALVLPRLSRVPVSAVGTVDRKERPPGVATGFSAGIDSYALLADHFFQGDTSRFKVTHLLFNNVGAHWAGGEALFQRRFHRLAPLAESFGLPFLKVNSNLDGFYEGFTFEETHTLRNASVALLLQGGIGCFLYASGYAYPEVFVGPSDSSNQSEAITLPLLSTGTLDAMSIGSEFTRPEKTLKVSHLPVSYETLDVCWYDRPEGPINCSKCEKCLRTQFTLDLLGQLQAYSSVFDLRAYRVRKEAYVADLVRAEDPYAREIQRFMRERVYVL